MLTLMALAMAAEPIERQKKIVTIVEIEGKSFKVRQKGNEAQVSRQSMVVNADAQHFSLAKRAAEVATGCVASEMFPVFGLLNVVLDCSKSPEPAGEDIKIRKNE